jgi:hypothetical protein
MSRGIFIHSFREWRVKVLKIENPRFDSLLFQKRGVEQIYDLVHVE